MRLAAIALALLVASCTSLPESMTIRFPDWMRGQGAEQRPQTSSATTPATATPSNPGPVGTPGPASVGAPLPPPSQPAVSSTTPAGTPAPLHPPIYPPAAAAAATGLPTGSFPNVHAAFTRQIETRYPAATRAATVRTDLTRDGFACAASGAGSGLSCERIAPIAGSQCSDVFIVSAADGTRPTADVRRRCPMGVNPPA